MTPDEDGNRPRPCFLPVIFATVQQVATGTLALLCVSWGTRALVRSRALWPLALVLYFLALPLACLSFLGWYGAHSG